MKKKYLKLTVDQAMTVKETMTVDSESPELGQRAAAEAQRARRAATTRAARRQRRAERRWRSADRRCQR